MPEKFITRPLSIALDGLRFGCAFLVMACHIGSGSLLYKGPWPFTERVSHYSVIVFFVLSGLVISASVADRQNSLKAYAISRATRIWPVAAVSVAFALLLHALDLAQSGPLPADYGAHSARSALLSLSFLSMSGAGGDLGWNSAYWSLCYEVWYYALFGAAMFLGGALRWLVLAAMAWVAGLPILLLLPVWLAGVWLNSASWPKTVSLARAPLLLTSAAVAALSVTVWDMNVLFALRDMVAPVSLGLSEWVISDYLMAAIVVVAIAAMRPLAARYADRLERLAAPLAYGAGFSFTLYLFHIPVIELLHLLGVSKGSSPAHLALSIILTLAICAVIAELVERRTPALRRWVTRILDRPAERIAAAA